MTTFHHTHPFFALFQRGFGAKSFERSKLALWHHGIRCHVRPYRYRQIRRWVLEGLLGLWSEIHSGEPLQPAITFKRASNAAGDAISLDDGRRFCFLYFHPTVRWADGCPGQLEPFTRCVNDVATIDTGAFNLPRVLLFAPAGVAASASGLGQMKSAVGQRSCCLQYRLHGLLELGACRGRHHLSYQANALGDSSELLAVASRDADRGVYQLVAQDLDDLHWHQVFRLA